MRFTGVCVGTVACLAVAGVVGCGSTVARHAGAPGSASASSEPTATADLSAGDILQRARAAGARVSSFTMAFSYVPDPSDPEPLHRSARLSWDRAGHCTGEVTIAGRGSAEVVVSGGTTWIRPDAAFARAEFGPAAAAMLAGKYLKGPTTDPHFADVSMVTDEYQKDLCQSGVLELAIPDEDDQSSTKLGRATVDGVPTVDVLPNGKGTADTFIAAEGTPYVIRSGGPGGTTFSDYGRPVAFQEPPAALTVNVAQLHAG